MSKKKPIKTNTNKKGTKQKNIFFPEVFRGKKLKKENWLGKSTEPLEKYLETEDTKYLFEAIKKNSFMLEMKHTTYDYYEKFGEGYEQDSVDGSSIVWISIKYWMFLHAFYVDINDNYLETENLLKKIGECLIPDKDEYVRTSITKDGFIHEKKYRTGKDYSTFHKNSSELANRYNDIKRILEEEKSKIRYNHEKDKELIKNDTIKAMKKISKKYGYDLYDDEYPQLDIKNNTNKALSILKLVHDNSCMLCKKRTDGIRLSTIKSLINKAKISI